MMKFFRKHNKKLIAIFMSLLMIVFVGGSALNSLMTSGRDQLVANSALGSISVLDQNVAHNTTRLLEALGQNWRQPVGFASLPITETDWILLIREAVKLGSPPSTASVRNLLSPLVDQRMNQVAHSFRVKRTRVVEALAELQAIQATAIAVAAAANLSEAAIRVAARNTLDKVKVNVVLLPASAFLDQYADLSEAEIESHFAAHADKEPAEGVNFGYYLPPMIRVQYVHIDPEAIAETIVVADLGRKARAFFDQNSETHYLFRKTAQEDVDEDPADEEFVGPPAPEQPADDSPFMQWEDAQEIATRLVKETHAKEIAGRIAQRILHYTGETWAEAERGTDGYKVAPAQCAQLDYFDSVMERIRVTTDYPGAVTTVTTEFFSADDASQLAGIGSARFRAKQGLSKSLQSLAFLTKGLVPEIPLGDGVIRMDYTAMFQPSQYPLADSAGNMYLFRVIDSQGEHQPESLAEVRDRVIDDLRLLRGFATAREHAEMLQVNATALGLQAAYDEDEELAILTEDSDESAARYLTPAAFARVPRYLAARGRQAAGTFVSGGLGLLPNKLTDQCFALQDA